MKKILLFWIAVLPFLACSDIAVYGQNLYTDGGVTLKLHVYQLWRNTYGDAGFGQAEDSYHIQLRDKDDLDGQSWLLNYNNNDGNNGWCFQGGGWDYPRTETYDRLILNHTYGTNNPRFYEIYYDTWEDDRGARCEYDCCNWILDDDDDRCGPGTVTNLPIRSLGAPCVDNYAGWQYFCGTSSDNSTGARIKVNYSTPKPKTSLFVNPCNAVLSSSLEGVGSYSGCSYTWERQGDGAIGSGQSISVSIPGSYRVVYNCNGCFNTSDWVIVTAPGTNPNAGAISGNQTICENTIPSILGSTSPGTGSGTITYQWQESTVDCTSGWTDIPGATSATYNPPAVSQTTYYRRIAIDCWGRTSFTECVEVTVNPGLNAGTISGNQTICEGGSTVFTSTVSGGTWSTSNSSTATIDNAGNITGISSGTATITYTVSDGGICPNATATLTVTVVEAPSAGVLSGNQTVCIGSSTTVTSTEPNGSWSSSNSGVAVVDNSGNVVAVSVGTTTISYTVAGGTVCPDAVETLTITVQDHPNPGTLSGNQTICVGSSTTFTSTEPNGSWSSSDNGVATIDNSGNISGVSGGTATITYTVSGGGICPDQDVTRTITVMDPPSAGTLSSDPSICIGNITSVTSTVPGGTWSSSDGSIATIDNSGNITGVAEGTVTVTYTVSGNGICPDASATITIEVANSVVPTIVIGGDAVDTVCAGEIVDLIANYTNGGNNPTFQWQVNGVNVTGATSSTFSTSGLNAGDVITVFMTSDDECANPTTVSDSTEPVVIAASVTPGVTISGVPTSEICEGTSVTFTANPTYEGDSPTYQWQVNGVDVIGETGSTFTTDNLNDGDVVTVIMNSSNPCASPSTVSGSTNANGIDVGDSQPPVFSNCPGNITVVLDEGCNIEVTWNAPEATDNCSTTTITSSHNSGDVFEVGTTTVTYTAVDESGNSSVCSFNIIVVDNEAPTVLTCVGDKTVYVGESSCEIVISDYTSNPELIVMDNCGGISTGNITVTQSPSSGNGLGVGEHNIVLTILDDSGNSTTCEFKLTVKDTISPKIDIDLNSSVNCEGMEVTWTEDISDNCEVASIQSNYQSGDTFPAGTTEVIYTVTDASGNTAHYTFIVFVEDMPEIPNLGNGDSLIYSCAGADAHLMVENVVEGYSYTWFMGDEEIGSGSEYVIETAQSGNSGTYSVVAENELGCQSEMIFILTIETCIVDVMETFSPNGDGKNDFFVIENLHSYPNTKIWIYDRWGIEVYQSENYQNDWDGTSTNKLNIGSEILPEGTYYYILELGGIEGQSGVGDIHKGYVYLKR